MQGYHLSKVSLLDWLSLVYEDKTKFKEYLFQERKRRNLSQILQYSGTSLASPLRQTSPNIKLNKN